MLVLRLADDELLEIDGPCKIRITAGGPHKHRVSIDAPSSTMVLRESAKVRTPKEAKDKPAAVPELPPQAGRWYRCENGHVHGRKLKDKGETPDWEPCPWCACLASLMTGSCSPPNQEGEK